MDFSCAIACAAKKAAPIAAMQANTVFRKNIRILRMGLDTTLAPADVGIFDASATRPQSRQTGKIRGRPLPGRRHGLLLVVFASLSGQLKTNRSRMATIC